MMSVPAAIEKAIANAEQLKAAGSANEANTRALVIEPVLAALGWDPSDLSLVDREICVFDGTFLDYALKLDGVPRLFVEAKAIGKSLDDKKFVSQTINYANNEGVVWCVLTNGLSYSVYKTNEPVPMDKKLLFAVDLLDAANGRVGEVVQALQRISRTAVADDTLDEWGERVFTDIRVRAALHLLAANPPEALYELLEATVEKPTPSRAQLRRSLQRLLDVPASVAPKSPAGSGVGPAVAGKGAVLPDATGGAGKYDMGQHTASKPAAVVDLFEQLDESTRALGADVVRKIGKVSVNYFAGKRAFCSLKTLNSKAVVFLVLDPKTTVSQDPVAMRDLTGMGHHGNGDVEYSLTSPDQLPAVRALIAQAYESAQ
jgi:predicted transport protein